MLQALDIGPDVVSHQPGCLWLSWKPWKPREDMEQEGERRLLEQTQLPDLEVLIAGHHGSDTSTTWELLDQTKPELALVSVGLHNKYGHPGWNAMERLDQAGAKIYRTDLYGTIEVRLNG